MGQVVWCPGTSARDPRISPSLSIRADLSMWIDRLNTLRIPVESRVDWERGGHSIYFRDPDGRSVELATPGVWPSY